MHQNENSTASTKGDRDPEASESRASTETGGDTVVATYTINAPAPKSDEDRLTTTFTIQSPHLKPKTSSASASATINVPHSLPLQAGNPEKTESDAHSLKPSPTALQSSFKYAPKPLSPTGGGAHETVISMGITDDDKNDKISTTANKTASSDLSGIGTKRSLLEMDNLSSLSLADKLHNEANKYANVSAQDADHRQASPTSYHPPLMSERRPSWRLKFDSGSKVRTMFTSFQAIRV